MRSKTGKNIILFLTMLAFTDLLYSQKLVESIAGIAGNEVIYLSDVENAVAQQVMSGDRTPVTTLRCMIFEKILTDKLFVDQARIDSVEVSDQTIESNLNMTLNRYIAQAGSEKALEDYFRKSMIEIRSCTVSRSLWSLGLECRNQTRNAITRRGISE